MDENINGFQAVIDEYRITNKAGTPGVHKEIRTVINKGIEISKEFSKKGIKQHIICLILTDGQFVSDDEAIRAISEASKYPISFCFLGIGDGDFDLLKKLDTLKEDRIFDNVHFTNFTEMVSNTTD